MQTWFDAQLDQKTLDGIYYLVTPLGNDDIISKLKKPALLVLYNIHNTVK